MTLKLFSKKASDVGQVRTISMWEHSGWGDYIDWSSWEERSLYGHMKDRPRNGDILRCKMESGKIATFVIKNVVYKSDPRDMFFAEAEDVGYEDEKSTTVSDDA